jgi:5-methylcytosine-specific restriction endonuclease McrA
MLSWSGEYLTTGVLTLDAAREFATPAELARLTRRVLPDRAPLVHGPGDRCDCLDEPVPSGLYIVHDFTDYNERRDEVMLRRAQKAELRDPALRLAVRTRDADRCRYCGRPCQDTPGRRIAASLVLDHVDPRRVAGAANLVVACHACNITKGHRTPAEAGMPLLPLATAGRGSGPGRAGAGTRQGRPREGAEPGSAGPAGVRDAAGPVADRRDSSGPWWRRDESHDVPGGLGTARPVPAGPGATGGGAPGPATPPGWPPADPGVPDWPPPPMDPFTG